MRRTDTGIVEGVDVVDFPLRPMEVMWDRVQVVELLGHDRPGRVTVQFFGKGCDLLPHNRFRIGEDQILQRDDLAVRSKDVGFPFAERGLARARVDDPCHDGNSAAHPEFIEPRTAHVIRIVGLLIEANPFSGGTKRSAGVTVQQLQHSAVLVQALIKNRRGSSAGSIDHVLLGILVKFFF